MSQGVEFAHQTDANQSQTEANVGSGLIPRVRNLILEHPVSKHEWFSSMEGAKAPELFNLLMNYDAHATLLRRLLLKAATLMPEPAVGFILENVRNEYGNGDYRRAHQKQLLNLVDCLVEKHCGGIRPEVTICDGVRQYMAEVQTFYFPEEGLFADEERPLISAGAITATEVLALEEFKALQLAFEPFGLADHIWFDHVNIEAEHADESMDLVAYFLREDQESLASIEIGIGGVLMCNTSLYDGFLQSVRRDRI